MKKLKGKELKVPVVYNTSSYENVSTIELLDGLVDVYLADFKYFDDELAMNYSNCKNYFDVASKAISKMYEQVGEPVFENDLMVRGVIVRLLLLPCHKEDVKKIIKYIDDTYKDGVYISIMNQYTPVEISKIEVYPELKRTITKREYSKVVDYALELGVENAFIQEGETFKESFIPEFNGDGCIKE